MEVDEKLEDAIRKYHDDLGEDSHHWDSLGSTRNKLLDVLLRKRKNYCICEYKNSVGEHPSNYLRKEFMFHVREKHGKGVDVSVFRGKIYECKECGEEIYTSKERQRKDDYKTEFIKYEDLRDERKKHK